MLLSSPSIAPRRAALLTFCVSRAPFLQKREAGKGIGDKPATVKTHLRDMPILPEMVGSMVAVYSGRVFNLVEIKPEMIGHYLAEFSISYKPTLHGRPGLGECLPRVCPPAQLGSRPASALPGSPVV